MREQIMQWGKQKDFKGVSNMEIYHKICDNFFIRDFAEARRCSMELWELFNGKGKVDQP